MEHFPNGLYWFSRVSDGKGIGRWKSTGRRIPRIEKRGETPFIWPGAPLSVVGNFLDRLATTPRGSGVTGGKGVIREALSFYCGPGFGNVPGSLRGTGGFPPGSL